MKAFLMHRDRDFDVQGRLPANEAALTQDLELETLWKAMAAGDRFLYDVVRPAVLRSLTDPADIEYRQHVLRDCVEHPDVVRELYQVAVDAITGERRMYLGLSRSSPDLILSRATQVMELLVDALRRLRRIAGERSASFRSEGFTRFFAMLAGELDAEYFQTVEDHLRQLRFKRGVLVSAQLGLGNKGVRHVLRKQPEQGWRDRLSAGGRRGYTFRVADRDETGFRALSELRGRGIDLAANALAQSADHILSFLRMLRSELAFYLGCLNLRERLGDQEVETCFPVAAAPGTPRLLAEGLYDVCLALSVPGGVVRNEVHADGARLVVITGANQGGKSTFLRSVGLAQLMMQCGMFVAAGSFRADVASGLFTHYKREEDTAMESGKLDEELSRMSEIVDQIRPDCLLLCNESFAATNEREGSEIGRQVVCSLVEAGVKVLLVTHLFDLAQRLRAGGASGTDRAVFLRAERRSDGRRTFKLREGGPLPTSYGPDSYRRIFGAPD